VGDANSPVGVSLLAIALWLALLMRGHTVKLRAPLSTRRQIQLNSANASKALLDPTPQAASGLSLFQSILQNQTRLLFHRSTIEVGRYPQRFIELRVKIVDDQTCHNALRHY